MRRRGIEEQNRKPSQMGKKKRDRGGEKKIGWDAGTTCQYISQGRKKKEEQSKKKN